MRRGEVWTAAGGKDYAGKPRPVVIVQSDAFDATESVTVCGLTTNPTEAPLARPVIEPNETNGLEVTCRLMADKSPQCLERNSASALAARSMKVF
jgi:mRNA interferase MazF